MSAMKSMQLSSASKYTLVSSLATLAAINMTKDLTSVVSCSKGP